jgi:hypothetical protein
MNTEDFTEMLVTLLTETPPFQLIPPYQPPACVHASFFAKNLTMAEKCSMASTNCEDLYDFVNFFKICYCWLSGHWIVTFPLNPR